MDQLLAYLHYKGCFKIVVKTTYILEKHSESAETSVKAAYYPHMTLFLVSLPSYPENFIKIC